MERETSHQDICSALNKEIASHSRILYCNRIDEYSKVWNTSFHEHDFLEIMYFIKGEALIEGRSSHRSLTANDLILYPPQFGHKEYMDFSRHQEVVCLAIELRRSFSFEEVITISDIGHNLEWIFTEMHRQYEKKENEIVRQLKYLLFSYIEQTSHSCGTATLPLSHRIQEYIQTHFRDHISQSELCELVNVSPSYLNRSFKAETGQTPVEFLNRIRIEEASTLMKKRHLTIEAVASEVGIKDPKYFSKLFKKITGFSPREFRQSTL